MKNRVLDPLQDGKSKIELIDYLGGDLSVVNDAKASFDKEAKSLEEKEKKLLNYLIENEHFSPLRGTVFKFKIKAPLFVCRQWYKHTIASSHCDDQLGWNEKSFRYTEITDEEEFYIPKEFRIQSKNNRQTSENTLSSGKNKLAKFVYETACKNSFNSYKDLLALGVGRELARGVLVPSVYTTWVWTTSLQATLHFVHLRTGKGAQSEISKYAHSVIELIDPIVPITSQKWKENIVKSKEKSFKELSNEQRNFEN